MPVSYRTFNPQPIEGGNATPVVVSGTIATTPETSATATETSVASSATNILLLASNAARKGAFIYNESTQVLYLKLGVTASLTSYTVQVGPNGFYELPNNPLFTGEIDGIWASANGNARVTELS